MEKQLNLLEILETKKDLVIGENFYSNVFGWGTLTELTEDKIFMKFPNESDSVSFDQFGRFSPNGNMVIFLNEDCVEEDWLSYKFSSGDFIIDNGTICIFKQINPDRRGYSVFAGIDSNDSLCCYTEEWGTLNHLSDAFFASEDDIEILLNRLYEEKRYCWDNDIHCLYSVFMPGDIIKTKFHDAGMGIVSQQNENGSIEFSLYFKNNKNFDPGLLISEPYRCYENYTPITEKSPDFRLITEEEFGEFIFHKEDYERQKYGLDKKFNPIVLKPFDKVLVRTHNSDAWECDFFSTYNPGNSNPFHCVNLWTEQCIPFNEDTQHLVGKTDEPDNYYITWENE